MTLWRLRFTGKRNLSALIDFWGNRLDVNLEFEVCRSFSIFICRFHELSWINRQPMFASRVNDSPYCSRLCSELAAAFDVPRNTARYSKKCSNRQSGGGETAQELTRTLHGKWILIGEMFTLEVRSVERWLHNRGLLTFWRRKSCRNTNSAWCLPKEIRKERKGWKMRSIANVISAIKSILS
jgi:hypothetical protein